ncbi:MAG TPA: hypothetical protein VFR34_08340 [Paracoccaceae bacterium]|nr:hypothetical protein [Paracoccaceae bacterium]
MKDSGGGAPVGLIADLGPLEREVVERLRAWDGDGAGRPADRAFAGLLRLVAAHCRRPLVRHAPGCPCLGGDEAAIALCVGHAARGERPDAGLIAAWLVRPEAAARVVTAAEEAGALIGARWAVPGPTRH